ncbi:MAG: ion transporter [Bacteroidales bacterium]
MDNKKSKREQKPGLKKMHDIIFKSDTYYGRLFDEILLIFIVLSILVVMLESVSAYRVRFSELFSNLEWFFTIVFTIEYGLRIISSPDPRKYIFSFLGIVDLLAIIPTYIAVVMPEVQPLIVIRSIRLLRIYRVLKLYRFVRAGNLLLLALRNSARKIFIFMMFIMILVIMLGSIMYVVEGASNGFFSIPLSIYWAVITLTTVGYGDIVPVTDAGKFIATFIMLLGYSIIAIPTGIVSVEMSRFGDRDKGKTICRYCNEQYHEQGANFCRVCGAKLE